MIILNLMKMTAISQKGRKHCGKRRIRSLRAISSFPIAFSKDVPQTRKSQGLFGNGFRSIALHIMYSNACKSHRIVFMFGVKHTCYT